MSLGGIILGLIDIAVVVAVLLLIGAIILWFLQWMGIALPDMVRKLYLAVVALVALYMLVALLLGIPGIRVLRLSSMALPPAWTTLGASLIA